MLKYDRGTQLRLGITDSMISGLATFIVVGGLSGAFKAQTDFRFAISIITSMVFGVAIASLVMARYLRTGVAIEGEQIHIRGLVRDTYFPVSALQEVGQKQVTHGKACLALGVKADHHLRWHVVRALPGDLLAGPQPGAFLEYLSQ